VVVGDKNLPNVEIKDRREKESRLVPLSTAAEELTRAVRGELAELNG